MTTIKATYTDSEENLILFATSKGWTEKITESQEITSEEGAVSTEQVEIDNPITKEEFISDFFRRLLIKEIVQPVERMIKQESRTQAQVMIDEKKALVEERLEVISE